MVASRTGVNPADASPTLRDAGASSRQAARSQRPRGDQIRDAGTRGRRAGRSRRRGRRRDQGVLVVEAMKMENELKVAQSRQSRRSEGGGRSDGRKGRTADRYRVGSEDGRFAMPEDDRKNRDRAAQELGGRKAQARAKRGPSGAKFDTSSGIEIKRAYDPDDLAASDFVDDLGFPGEYPFTRGVQPTMYRGRLWTMRQYAGFGTAEESNRALPLPLRAGADRSLGRVRSADPDGPRLRPSAGRRRGRTRRRVDLTRSPTWRRCSTSCRSTRFRPR